MLGPVVYQAEKSPGWNGLFIIIIINIIITTIISIMTVWSTLALTASQLK